MFLTEWYVIPFALIMDLILGDPRKLPHPVRWMGNAIIKAEPFFRRLGFSTVTNGALFAYTLIFSTLLIGLFLLSIVSGISHFLGIILETIMVYYCISARSLNDEAMEVYKPVLRGNIELAREKLSYIVGRDTKNLTMEGILRAGIETVAENFVDGIVSPLFYATILGGPFALCYKMINTLDSMVGYRNEKYEEFGRFAAKTDDVANYIPARISVHVIALTSKFFNGREHHVYRTCGEEGRNHKSPNSGLPEAAFSAVLDVKLGGPNYYFGKLVDKPFIGTRHGEPKNYHLRRACEFMILSTLVYGLICSVVSYILA